VVVARFARRVSLIGNDHARPYKGRATGPPSEKNGRANDKRFNDIGTHASLCCISTFRPFQERRGARPDSPSSPITPGNPVSLPR